MQVEGQTAAPFQQFTQSTYCFLCRTYSADCVIDHLSGSFVKVLSTSFLVLSLFLCGREALFVVADFFAILFSSALLLYDHTYV